MVELLDAKRAQRLARVDSSSGAHRRVVVGAVAAPEGSEDGEMDHGALGMM